MKCTARHENGVGCWLSGTHAEHAGFPDNDPRKEQVYWDNTSFVAPVKPGKRGAQQHLVALAAKVKAVDTPHAWVQNDAPETSVRAADVSAVRNSRRRRQVLQAIASVGHDAGMTDDEVAVFCGEEHMPAPRVASRRKELQDWGWVEPLGEMQRMTRANNLAVVWALTPSGWSSLPEVDFSDL